MSEELVVKNCSPTLAGIKTGNIFSCSFESEYELRRCIRAFNRKLVKKGLRVIPLRIKNNRALIYIFRPSRLYADLKNPIAEKILKSFGYDPANPELCLIRLIKRINENGNFPHEIGLFLGYPPSDVLAFIENKAQDFKLIGCWKVYSDEENAKKTFERYKKCTDIYCAMLKNGHPVEKLAVSAIS